MVSCKRKVVTKVPMSSRVIVEWKSSNNEFGNIKTTNSRPSRLFTKCDNSSSIINIDNTDNSNRDKVSVEIMEKMKVLQQKEMKRITKLYLANKEPLANSLTLYKLLLMVFGNFEANQGIVLFLKLVNVSRFLFYF